MLVSRIFLETRQQRGHNIILPTPTPSPKWVIKLSSHDHDHQIIVLILILSCILLYRPVESTYPFIYAGCSPEKYTTDSQISTPAFESNLNSLLTSLVSSASRVSYNSFALGINNGSSASVEVPQENNDSIYGLYQCRGDLQISECSSCIQSLVNQINLVCPYSYGATLQLEGCYLRYDRLDFLGKPDLTVTYKRCSTSLKERDTGFLKQRDDVLVALQKTAVAGFRVSSSGSVQGYGQCLGDLYINTQAGYCPSCLAEAVAKLKSLCGPAAAASIFLSQCYARYWDAGYSDINSVSDDTNKDDVGKMVAIIVGILGGLAVFIVILSLCRRSMGGRRH